MLLGTTYGRSVKYVTSDIAQHHLSLREKNLLTARGERSEQRAVSKKKTLSLLSPSFKSNSGPVCFVGIEEREMKEGRNRSLFLSLVLVRRGRGGEEAGRNPSWR